MVARYAHDAHDWWLWNELGRPPSYRYSYSVGALGANAGHAELTPYIPAASSPLRFEAEAEWPPLAVHNGWVQPDFVPCASNGRGLRLHPSAPSASSSLDFELALPAESASRTIRLGWISPPGPPTQLRLIVVPELNLGPDLDPRLGQDLDLGRDLHRDPGGCGVVEWGPVRLGGGPVRVRLEAAGGGVLDYIEVR